MVADRLQGLDTIGAKALLFTILTAARTTETLGARWQEIDFIAKLWIVPADRMKMKREHRVVLSDQAIILLDRLPRSGEYIFPGQKPNRPLSNLTMLKCLREIRGDTGETVHGFRSSFSTWAAEATSHPREIVEAALAHATGDAVELAYKRTDYLDKRRALMREWAGFVVRNGTNDSTP
jgi:integrase